MRPVYPGEILRGELDELGAVGRRAVEGAGRAGEPGDDDPERPAGRECGHGAQAGALFRDDAAILAEPAKDLGASPVSWQAHSGPKPLMHSTVLAKE